MGITSGWELSLEYPCWAVRAEATDAPVRWPWGSMSIQIQTPPLGGDLPGPHVSDPISSKGTLEHQCLLTTLPGQWMLLAGFSWSSLRGQWLAPKKMLYGRALFSSSIFPQSRPLFLPLLL